MDLIWAAVNHDSRLATDTLVAVSENPEIDEVSLYREVDRLISKYHGVELGRIEFGPLMNETLGLIRGHALGVPADFALLLSTLAVLEGVGTMLDPSFDFAKTAKPFADAVMRERLQPDVVARKATRSFRHAIRILEMLPDTAERVSRRLARGEIGMSVRPIGYAELVAELHKMVGRLSFAIVVAALVIGFATLLSATDVPGWVRIVGEVGMVLAFVVSVWFFASILWARHRRRKR